MYTQILIRYYFAIKAFISDLLFYCRCTYRGFINTFYIVAIRASYQFDDIFISMFCAPVKSSLQKEKNYSSVTE